MATIKQQCAAGEKEQARLRELRMCQKSLWYFSTRYLNYGWSDRHNKGLTERVHRPIMGWLDRHREDPLISISMARTRHKTTIAIAQRLQSILIDPCKSHLYFHNVDDVAAATLSEVVNHCMANEKLRSLDPIGIDEDGKRYKVFPTKIKRRWYNQTSMTLNRHRFSRTPTMSAYGIGTEVTGLHVDGDTDFDDIIALRTILNSELQKVRNWVQSTAMPLSDSKRFRAWWTPWSEHSIYQEWQQSKAWISLMLPGAIEESDDEFFQKLRSSERKLHFVPSYQFTNPMFGPEEFKPKAVKMLRFEQEHMKSDFSPQIMLDSEPESERPWSASCEHFTGMKAQDHMPGILGRGATFILSDPAPLHVGGFKGLTEKQRGDGTKDYWSIQAWKLRPRGQIMDAILLDGIHSQQWTKPQGTEEIARMMKKWATTFYICESADEYFDDMRSACLRLGVSMTRARDGGPLKFASYNKADRKNTSFSAFAAKAALGEVWIYEECPKDFLYGDSEHTGLLTQARKWRSIGPNKNSLRFDDDADCASRSLDPALLEFAPRILPAAPPEEEWSPFRRQEEESFTYKSRYISF